MRPILITILLTMSVMALTPNASADPCETSSDGAVWLSECTTGTGGYDCTQGDTHQGATQAGVDAGHQSVSITGHDSCSQDDGFHRSGVDVCSNGEEGSYCVAFNHGSVGSRTVCGVYVDYSNTVTEGNDWRTIPPGVCFALQVASTVTGAEIPWGSLVPATP